MTNSELKAVLQKMLDDGDLDATTVVILQDASIHVVQKMGFSLREASSSYAILAAGHEVFRDLLGVDMSTLDIGPTNLEDLLQTLRGPTLDEPKRADEQQRQVSEEERKRLNALLKDIKLD